MIEINLVPDVKQEYIRARRLRNAVISFCILAMLAAGGLIVLLVVYVFGIQTVRHITTDNSITSEHQKLSAVSDLGNALTVQHQLTVIPSQHDDKKMQSRVFDVLTTIIDSSGGDITVAKLAVDTENTMITIEGEADSGYKSLEKFKKTIAATEFSYTPADGNTVSIPLATQITDGERSYGASGNGQRTLRFTLSFGYDQNLLARTAKSGSVIAPERKNATDSALAVPKSLFNASGAKE